MWIPATYFVNKGAGNKLYRLARRHALPANKTPLGFPLVCWKQEKCSTQARDEQAITPIGGGSGRNREPLVSRPAAIPRQLSGSAGTPPGASKNKWGEIRSSQ